jgi:hypothetical protein
MLSHTVIVDVFRKKSNFLDVERIFTKLSSEDFLAISSAYSGMFGSALRYT